MSRLKLLALFSRYLKKMYIYIYIYIYVYVMCYSFSYNARRFTQKSVTM